MFIKNSKQLKVESKGLIRGNRTRILLHALGYIILSYLLMLLFYQLSGYSSYVSAVLDAVEAGESASSLSVSGVSGVSIILAILVLLVSAVLSGGYTGYCLIVARGVNARFRNIIPPGNYMLKIVGLTLVTEIIEIIGYILFIIPGILLSYRFRMALYIMYDHPEMGVIKCMRESGYMMKGNKMRLFKMDLSFILWDIADTVVSLLLGPIVAIWLDPYKGIARAIFYNDLSHGGTYGLLDME